MADELGFSYGIDSSIPHHQLLSILSRSDSLRPIVVYDMAFRQLQRYMSSNQWEDLDEAIAHFTELILLPPLSWLRHGPITPIILHALFYFASSLCMRSELSRQPEDAIYGTKYFFHLREQPHEIPNIQRRRVTESLLDALALQVTLEAGNVMQNIREMAILCLELLTMEAPNVNRAHLIALICAVAVPNIRPGVPDQPLDELIKFLRAARKHRPDILDVRVAISTCLGVRYSMTGVNGDYEEATSILDEIIASPGNSQDESVSRARGGATGFAAALAFMRAVTHQSPECVEEAIYRNRACLNSPSVKEHFPSALLDPRMDPELIAKLRFRDFGSIEGLEESSRDSLLSHLLSLKPEFRETVNKMEDLLSGIHSDDDGDITKSDEAVEKGRSLLGSSPNVIALNSFGDLLFEAFRHTRKIEYLNESISVRRQEIEAPLPQGLRFATLPPLFRSLLARSQLFPNYRTQDLDEGLELLPQYLSNVHASLPDRFQYACEWTRIARHTRHSSTSTAYETAMSLMQDTLLFSPTLQQQHATLATHASTQSLPLDYASYRVDQHELEKAIETLERGRALLWSEMRHLRTSIDRLNEVDPDLGRKFAAVNQDLEELTKSVPPSHKLSMDDGTANDLGAVDPFGRLVLKQRGLLKERDKLISQIQALPNFDGFLVSPSFDTLRSAALSGPVIIINHTIFRSDIIVLLYNMPPALITTPKDFFERADTLKEKLLGSRQKYGLDSSHYDDTLAAVLAELYTLVGQPVVDRLHQLQVPEQSRIWWCPTSVFCFLPLHAMGPIPSDGGESRYFLDLYICSYTPTLSALIQSRNRSLSSRSDRPSILLVAQPDPSLPTVGGEIQVVQALDTEVTSLISETATPSAVIEGLHHHQFVHFACHGKLEDGKPFEAGFELYGDKRLSLLEIVRSHLPTAEFAFLSACHTAEVTEGSITDEGLHLAAAVQYCGFHSVVGTMWAMVDEDGRELAENFYKLMFSNPGPRGMSYHERSAKALRFAVRKLRRKRQITLERWVNFVHYGA